jgi:hypothetical protein
MAERKHKEGALDEGGLFFEVGEHLESYRDDHYGD